MTTAPAALSPLGRLLLTLAAATAVLAGMRVASPILGPVFIALMITIAWSPGADWLRARGWRPSVAALTGIVLGVLLILLFVGLVWISLIQLQDKLPGYQPRIEALQQLVQYTQELERSIGSLQEKLARLEKDEREQLRVVK